MFDAILTAMGKPGSPMRAVFIGTLAPASGGWWHDLIEGGSHGSTYVQALQGNPEKWDQWAEIRRCNPLSSYPELRKKLLEERDAARADSRLKARFLSYRLTCRVQTNRPCCCRWRTGSWCALGKWPGHLEPPSLELTLVVVERGPLPSLSGARGGWRLSPSLLGSHPSLNKRSGIGCLLAPTSVLSIPVAFWWPMICTSKRQRSSWMRSWKVGGSPRSSYATDSGSLSCKIAGRGSRSSRGFHAGLKALRTFEHFATCQ